MPPTDPDRKGAQIARINELSGLARTAWFSLLGYLVFVGITLLGVKDADFFVPSRQTELPLVGVQIPTASFFYVAPILGAALYTYLHLFLIKLWDAHAEARTGDDDATHHWLVNDFVLLRQHDPDTRARPLSWLIAPITWLLVWAAGPIVLGYAWWRSMPAHNEWMTLLIAACFWLALVVGTASWRRADFLIGPRLLHPSAGAAVPAAGLAALLLVSLSWLRTEGGLDRYAAGFWTLDDVSFTIPAGTPVVRWFTDEEINLPLARTDIAGERLVALPEDWHPPSFARSAFLETWCTQPTLTDGSSDGAEERLQIYGTDSRPDLNDKDLRLAIATSVSLPGANLTKVRMGHANLSQAQLDGAALSQAEMDDVDLSEALLRGTDLSGARLNRATLAWVEMGGASLCQAELFRANLHKARMDGANLRMAIMNRATLSFSQLRGADLSGAQLAGANMPFSQMQNAALARASLHDATLTQSQFHFADLYRAKMTRVLLNGARLDGANLRLADLREATWNDAVVNGALVHSADLRGAKGLVQAQLDGAIGNSGTLLPERPAGDFVGYYVRSCWEVPPLDFERIVHTAAGPTSSDADRAELRAQFLCGPSEIAIRTGTPLALDKVRPAGHPLGPGVNRSPGP